MAAREENILNVPTSETFEGMHVLCDTGDTGEPYRVAASLFIAEATQAAKDAVANLDPKDVILKGFTALTAGKPAITANSTLLAAIQSLYAMAGSGKVKIISDGADQTGMVCWNGTSASGFVINVNEAAIYTRSQWTQSNPDSVTDANWIAAVKTGGTKTPFAAAAQNPNMGDLPINSRLKFVDNKTTILGMLKMLTAAANVGRLRIVSGNPATGASGKPELAFIVNIVQGANAETQGTNGLQIFHLTNDYIRVIPSSSVAMAWPTLQTLTDEDVIKKLNSTASGDWGGLGVTMEWAGSGGSAMKCLTVTDFTHNTFSNGAFGDLAVGEMFTFKSAVDAANGPGAALVGYAVKVSALSVKYVGTSTSINTYRRSYLYTYQSTGVYNTNWSIVGTPTGIEASVYEFAYGESEGVPTADLKFVKVADIFRMIFSTPDQADYVQLDFIRSQDHDKTDQYVFVCPSVDTGSTFGGALQRIAVDATTGAVDMTGVTLAIANQPATTIQVTNFNAPTNNIIKRLATGQGVIICTADSGVGGPSGVTAPLYGHCFKSSSGPFIYTYLLQTADGSRIFSGSTNGTTAQWTELGGGGGEQTVIWINANQNVFDVGLYPFTKLGEMFPIFIDTSATNNPSKEGYPCAGTVQCVGYQGPESWEAVFVVGSADEDQTPRGDYYKAHLSYDMGGSAWIELTTGSSGVKKLPGLDMGLNESIDVITYASTELVPLSAGTTLLLCFELADSDARFSPCGNVVVHYDLPPANSSWGTIAGFFDNATCSNGFINARRCGAGAIDFQCFGALVDGYPSLQVYLKHILILG